MERGKSCWSGGRRRPGAEQVRERERQLAMFSGRGSTVPEMPEVRAEDDLYCLELADIFEINRRMDAEEVSG